MGWLVVDRHIQANRHCKECGAPNVNLLFELGDGANEGETRFRLVCFKCGSNEEVAGTFSSGTATVLDGWEKKWVPPDE